MMTFCDTGGGLYERFRYDAYGVPTLLDSVFALKTSADVTEWESLYASYRWDSDTGLYQVRNRIYHPTLGRWNRRDPVKYKAGPNLYLYGQSAPLGFVDPYGLDDHHWIPRLQGRGYIEVHRICCQGAGIRVDLDRFTTTFPGGMQGKIGESKRSAHSALHYIDKNFAYNSIAKLIFQVSQSCCQLLVSFEALRTSVVLYLQAVNAIGKVDPPLRESIWSLHPWGEPGDTSKDWYELITSACAEQDQNQKVVPQSVQVNLDRIMQETHRINPPWYTRNEGLESPGDEFTLFLLLFGPAWRWVFGARAAGTAASSEASNVIELIPKVLDEIIVRPAA